MKVSKKLEFEQISLIIHQVLTLKNFMNFYKKFTAKPYPF